MAYCDAPFSKQDENHVWQLFPCGKCLNCMNRRASGWSFRLIQQGEVATSSLFVTLTYNTDTVPITPNGYMNLSRPSRIPHPKKPGKWKQVDSDLQAFFKRLRYYEKRNDIKYYACGEYGEKKSRPHYHIILFNASIQNVLNSWKLGEVHLGTVSDASIGYTLKYMSKIGRIPEHANDDRLKEFAVMSKGLGSEYLNEETKQWHKADLTKRAYLPLKDGKKACMPRYYKDRIYNSQERGYLKGVFEKLAKEQDEAEREELGEEYQHTINERRKNNFRKLKQKSKNETGTF